MTPRSILFLAIAALSAACGLVVEITAGRMIAPYLGMSLYTWTSIIAVVLAGFSIGHWIGGRIAEQPASLAQRNVAWSLLFAGISCAGSLVLIRVLSGAIINAGLGPVSTILLLTTALFFLPSLFVGIPSPALTKLAIDENTETMGRTIGAFYAAGAAGSIIGTLAAGFVFISWLGTIGTIQFVSAAYLIMAASLFSLQWKTEKIKSGLAPTLVAVVMVLFLALTGQSVLAFRSNCDVESDYYCIRIVDLERQIGIPARSMILDHLEHGVNVEDRPGVLLAPYVEAQDSLARLHTQDRPKIRAFFIGGGAYTLPRAWLAGNRENEIHVAEVDPEVTRAARKRLWLPKSQHLIIVHEDARRALNNHEGDRFDVIVGDAFHDISVPQHLVTKEFFSLVRTRLKRDGIYLMNIVDHLRRPRLVLSVVESLKISFPVVEVWKSNQAGERATFVVVAAFRPTPQSRVASSVTRGQAYDRVPVDTLTTLRSQLEPFALTDNYAPVDRLIAVR